MAMPVPTPNSRYARRDLWRPAAGAGALVLTLAPIVAGSVAAADIITVRTDTLYTAKLAHGGDTINATVIAPTAPTGYRPYYAEVTFTVGAILDRGQPSLPVEAGPDGGPIVRMVFYVNSAPNGANTGGISTIGPRGGSYTLLQQYVNQTALTLTMTLPGAPNDQYRDLSFVVAWTAVALAA